MKKFALKYLRELCCICTRRNSSHKKSDKVTNHMKVLLVLLYVFVGSRVRQCSFPCLALTSPQSATDYCNTNASLSQIKYIADNDSYTMKRLLLYFSSGSKQNSCFYRGKDV